MKNINGEQQETEQSLRKISHDTGETLGSISSTMKESTNDYIKKGKAYVNENPNKSLALSAMAGAVVGSIVTLVSKRRK